MDDDIETKQYEQQAQDYYSAYRQLAQECYSTMRAQAQSVEDIRRQMANTKVFVLSFIIAASITYLLARYAIPHGR